MTRLLVFIICLTPPIAAMADDLAAELRELDTRVLPTDDASRKRNRYMLHDYNRAQLLAANKKSSAAWHAITNSKNPRKRWEQFRHEKLDLLRNSVAQFPKPPNTVSMVVTRTIKGEGFTIRNIVYNSRPGLNVTANLYVPDPVLKSCPGILINHSHHRPKTHGELQDMGMTWARLGCYVLVPDQINHGERRQHPFVTSKDYAKEFRVSRQDYYFRYNVGIHLHLIGDSLIGWMAWDNMRGFDVLMQQKHIDADRLIIIGAVAGGGDPAAVTAALDERIDAAVPFNFGGPQPETRYPLSEDIEQSFNYAGSGSWESTRNIAFSAQHGFLPWIIVSSIAPRRLIHAHEFNWDKKRDPIWKRYGRIYGFYGMSRHLEYALGFGELKQSSKVASHCTHVGPVHRKHLYRAFSDWFGMPAPEMEYQIRRDEKELMCLSPQLKNEFISRFVHDLAGDQARESRKAMTKLREEHVQSIGKLQHILSFIRDIKKSESKPNKLIAVSKQTTLRFKDISVDKFAITVEPGIVVPTVLLMPDKTPNPPIAIMIAQGGKERILKSRTDAISTLLFEGVAVCVPDLRGTGETSPTYSRPGERERRSWDTSLSMTNLMLGESLVELRLRDLGALMAHLRTRKELDSTRFALWGDSLAPVNPPDLNPKVPLGVGNMPKQSEPLGGLMTILAGNFEKDVKTIYVRGGLTGFDSIMNSQFIYAPHDVIVPGVLAVSDIPDVVANLTPLHVRLEGLVTGLNQRATPAQLKRDYQTAIEAFKRKDASQNLTIQSTVSDDCDIAKWMASKLKGSK